jgi:hypothetical protein
MPFIPLPNGIKVCFRYVVDGQQVCNVFYGTTTEDIDMTFLDGLGGALVTWWTTYMKPNLPPDCALQAIELTDAEEIGGVGIEYVAGLPSAGTFGSNGLPNNVTYAIKLASGHIGRSYNGRTYWPAVAFESKSGVNRVTSDFRTAATLAISELINAFVDASAQLVVASFHHAGAPRTEGVATPVAGAVTTDDILDSQRRRLPGRGA